MNFILLLLLCTFSNINCLIRLSLKCYSKMRGRPEEPDQNNGNQMICNPGQSIWNNLNKSSKTGQEQNFNICFCVFFNRYNQSLFLEVRHGTRLCLYPILRFFLYSLIFLRSFGNSGGISQSMFFMLDIKHLS